MQRSLRQIVLSIWSRSELRASNARAMDSALARAMDSALVLLSLQHAVSEVAGLLTSVKNLIYQVSV